MATGDKIFAGSIPQIYERYLVPLIFEACARDIAKRLAALNAEHVLETAAGTGVVTRAIAAQLPASTHFVATDLNQPMLDHAKSRLSQGTRIEWKAADAQKLPFADEGFDAVVCQFGVMFFPDKVQAYQEACRVLKPGGRFIFNVWDRISENDFADVVTDALAELFPSDPPRFLARIPHGYYNIELIRTQLNEAGFADMSIDAMDERSKASSPSDPAIAYCQGTPLRNEIEARDANRLQEATACAADAVAKRFGTGAVDGRIRAFVITASR